ncbi:hypothetical protein BN1051_01998 [Arthrobacter saudimassiliensis]|uniref:Polysaccharide biosynthesis protein n=1 Tax=Arthrobacter saudimassiliensis TaxID=1461584 RepID=A0A078MV03_9MICC|nr:hypothetical protein BN1051_01998 [Arthrobacter saudimassiliensis]
MLAALSGFLILFIVARVLSPADNAEFLSFWAALFAVYGVLNGLTAETTRAVGSVNNRATAQPHRIGVSVFSAGLLVGGALAALVLALGLPFAHALFGATHGQLIVLILAATCIVYAVHASLGGALQGMGLWPPYTMLVGLEAMLRVGAIGLAAALGAGLLGIEMATLAALGTWLLVLLFSPSARAALPARADVTLVPFLRQTGHALVSSVATAALVVSYPLLVRLTTSPEEFALSAPLLLAVSLTRAPIMLPLQAFQGVVITQVIRARDRGLQILRKPALVVLSLGVGGGVLAAWVGPWIMLLFGPDYVVEGWVLGALTLAASFIAFLTLFGTTLLAQGNHRAYAAGWLLATALAVAALLLPYSTEVRVILSLSVGPMAGIAVHALALRSRQGH